MAIPCKSYGSIIPKGDVIPANSIDLWPACFLVRWGRMYLTSWHLNYRAFGNILWRWMDAVSEGPLCINHAQFTFFAFPLQPWRLQICFFKKINKSGASGEHNNCFREVPACCTLCKCLTWKEKEFCDCEARTEIKKTENGDFVCRLGDPFSGVQKDIHFLISCGSAPDCQFS